MRKSSGKVIFVNACGAFGYMFCLLLWGWVGILYVPMLLQNETIEKIIIPTQSENSIAIQPIIEPSPVTAAIAVGVSIVVVILTIIALFKMPKTITKAGKTITTNTAKAALPIVIKGRKITPAKKQRLTADLIKLTKLAIVVLPVLISLLGMVVKPPMQFEVTIFVSSTLAICAAVWFSLQYAAARLLLINAEQLV